MEHLSLYVRAHSDLHEEIYRELGMEDETWTEDDEALFQAIERMDDPEVRRLCLDLGFIEVIEQFDDEHPDAPAGNGGKA